MKFNKQLSNGGLFLPSAALKISGFEDSGQVEIHALKNTAVIMKQQMTAMELIQALDSLNQLFINLSFHFAKTCGACSGCEGRKQARIPKDAPVLRWHEFLRRGLTYHWRYKAEKKAQDEAVILYSGGTTGVTKGIQLTKAAENPRRLLQSAEK